MTALYDDALIPVGVNIAQFSLLRNISRMAPVSLTSLGEAVDLDRSTVGRNAKVLERMGLVVLGEADDQREAVLTLSEQGVAVLAEGAPLWDEVQAYIEAKLGGPNAKQLKQLLATL